MKRLLTVLLSLIVLAGVFVSAPSAARAEYTLVEVTKGASVRSAAGYNGEKLMLAQPGEQFMYLGTEGKWYAIRTKDGVNGYLPADSTRLVQSVRLPDGYLPQVPEDQMDEPYKAGIAYMSEGKFYSARESFLMSDLEEAEIAAQQCIQDFPATGEIWHNSSLVSNEMFLDFAVLNSEDSVGRCFMVYTEDGRLASILFVSGKGTAQTKLPGGHYRIRDAAGTEWYGTKEFFGRDGEYEYMVFEEFDEDEYLTDLPAGYEWTISINTNGQEQGTGVSSDDMDWDTWSADIQ